MNRPLIAVTNSMPVLRTSVDHGTAFDIAGRGIASAVSMIEAVKVAAAYAPRFAALRCASNAALRQE